MKKLLLLMVLLSISACSARDYHLVMLNESISSSKQTYHIQAIQDLDRQSSIQYARVKGCDSYYEGLGSFTTGCN